MSKLTDRGGNVCAPNDRIGVIVQARMRSHRLNGKMLRALAGRPMLDYVLERVSRCRSVTRIVVSTSTESDDDPIESYCEESGTACFRGDHENVALRFLETLNKFGFDAFVRICGDSVFIDPQLVDQAVGYFRTGQYDLVTNNLRRTFPAGQTVEVVGADVFRRAYPRMRTRAQQEHVTRYFYDHSEDFEIFNIAAEKSYTQFKLSVDTREEFDRAGELICWMERPHWDYGWREIVANLCTTTC